MSSKLIYYVYAYVRQTDSATAKAGTPYYIGKGKDNRAYGKHGKLPVPNDKSRIIIMETNLSELGAFALERRYINWWGRKDLSTGILYNRTDGGEGTSGCILSEETKQKMSLASTGRIMTDERKKRISDRQKVNEKSKIHREELAKKRRGMTFSEEIKQKMSMSKIGNQNRTGIPHTEETKRIISERTSDALKGKPRKKSICPYCSQEGGAGNMTRFHFDNCKSK